MNEIAIVDYGVGNLHSVKNAFAYLGFTAEITADAARLRRADHIILPGVGAFPDAAEKLRARGLDQVVLEEGERKPVLGICLGMQLLLAAGEEVRPCQGLGAVEGLARRISTALKLPHIGWNQLRTRGDCPLFRELEEGDYVYFIHSFSAQQVPSEQIAATTDYDGEVVAAVWKGNFFGCQFHPEKSGEKGLAILESFARLNRG